MSDEQPDTLLEFPCQFPIKVFGENHQDFEAVVIEIVNRHCTNLSEGAVKSRQSSKGNFMSMTVTIEAHSKQQIDAIYLELTAHSMVKMAL